MPSLRRMIDPLDLLPMYVGLVTRALAFALDAALVNAVAILTAAAVALFLSVVSVPHDVRVLLAAIGGVAYVAWSSATSSRSGPRPARRRAVACCASGCARRRASGCRRGARSCASSA
jgi:hypothetical protein